MSIEDYCKQELNDKRPILFINAKAEYVKKCKINLTSPKFEYFRDIVCSNFPQFYFPGVTFSVKKNNNKNQKETHTHTQYNTEFFLIRPKESMYFYTAQWLPNLRLILNLRPKRAPKQMCPGNPHGQGGKEKGESQLSLECLPHFVLIR